MGAGRPEPGPGQLQDCLGGGRQTSDRRRLRRRLQKLGGALQKVRSPRRQVRRKILRNKHPPSSNPSQFIDGFAFFCIHTSYFTDWSIYSWTTVLQLVLIFSVRKLNFRVHMGVHTVQSYACAYLWFQHVFYYDIKAPCIELFEHNWAQVAVGKCVWKGQFLNKCTWINVRYKRILTSGF